MTPQWTVGQDVELHKYGICREAKVTKVGRDYVYVGRLKFRRDQWAPWECGGSRGFRLFAPGQAEEFDQLLYASITIKRVAEVTVNAMLGLTPTQRFHIMEAADLLRGIP